MFQYYAWRHLQQTHQKLRWYPGNTESLEALLQNQVLMWNAHAPSLFLIPVGWGITQTKAKNVTQSGVIAFREVDGTRQLVFQDGALIRVLLSGDTIRKPEALNLLPPSLRRGEESDG